ncbi:DUF3108 domain-containing protein [bacterium]|nr:DUF3108 domain-containing protein [bacterium]
MKVSQFQLILLLFLCVSMVPLAGASDELHGAPALSIRVDSIGQPPLPLPFALGEEMIYHVSFGAVPAGKAQLRVIDTAMVNDQWSWVVQSSARSAKAFDWVFKVRDTITTWVDMDSVYSHRFHKKLMEGFYQDEKLVKFSPHDSSVRWWDEGKEKDMQKVDPYVQDVLSAGYRTRCLDFDVGDTVSIRTHDVNKTYDLFVIVHARDTVQTLAGEFDCFVCEPVLKSGGLFKKEGKARVFVWVTADARRIPVVMSSRVSFGSFTVELEEFRPGIGKLGISEIESMKARTSGRPDLGIYAP